MRKSNMLWLALAAVCGVALFHTSQQVTDGRERLAKLRLEDQKEEETIRVLQAEWSYLNQPERLDKLSRQYLGLEPLKARQFAKLEDLPSQEEKTVEAEAAPIAAAPEPVSPAPQPAAVFKPAPAVAKAAVAKPAVKIASPPKTVAAARLPQPVPPKPAVKTAPAPKQASTAPTRDFNSLMKSLGVQ